MHLMLFLAGWPNPGKRFIKEVNQCCGAVTWSDLGAVKDWPADIKDRNV